MNAVENVKSLHCSDGPILPRGNTNNSIKQICPLLCANRITMWSYTIISDTSYSQESWRVESK